VFFFLHVLDLLATTTSIQQPRISLEELLHEIFGRLKNRPQNSFPDTIKRIRRGKHIYLAEVKSVRKGKRVRHEFIRYIGKEVDGKPERKVSTGAVRVREVRRYLDAVCIDRLAKELGLEDLFGEHGKHALVFLYSHLMDRPSINKMKGWLTHTEILPLLGLDSMSTKELYETLTHVDEVDFEPVEHVISNRLSRFEKYRRSVVIDVTDTYFEGKTWDVKRRRGKDGKYRKLIQIALAVTEKHGFPIFHKVYGGNVPNALIFKDMLVELKKRRIRGIIMDRGMYSNHNIDSAIDAKTKLICGVRKSKSFVDGFLSKIDREEIYSPKHRVTLKNTAVYVMGFPYKNGALLAVYNPELEVVKRHIHYEKGEDEREARYLGYSLIFHNTELSEAEAVRKYFDKDIVDKAFKELKGILSLRPVRVWTREHVRGHVRICYLAYALLSLMNYRVRRIRVTAVTALEHLKTGYKVHLLDEKSGFEWSTIVMLNKMQQRILKACKCSA
jgi:transposase